MLLTVVITMLQLAFFYLVPYFLMLAFGRHEVDFFSVMAASAFVQLLSSAVPLPGGTGGAEGGFALFLGHFFGSASTAGYLLWRLITFIAPTILAAPLLGLERPQREHPCALGSCDAQARPHASDALCAHYAAPHECCYR